MIQMGNPARGRVPVAPGSAPVVPDDAVCALCGAAGDERRMWVVVGHRDAVVCVDTLGCVHRALLVVAS